MSPPLSPDFDLRREFHSQPLANLGPHQFDQRPNVVARALGRSHHVIGVGRVDGGLTDPQVAAAGRCGRLRRRPTRLRTPTDPPAAPARPTLPAPLRPAPPTHLPQSRASPTRPAPPLPCSFMDASSRKRGDQGGEKQAEEPLLFGGMPQQCRRLGAGSTLHELGLWQGRGLGPCSLTVIPVWRYVQPLFTAAANRQAGPASAARPHLSARNAALSPACLCARASTRFEARSAHSASSNGPPLLRDPASGRAAACAQQAQHATPPARRPALPAPQRPRRRVRPARAPARRVQDQVLRFRLRRPRAAA